MMQIRRALAPACVSRSHQLRRQQRQGAVRQAQTGWGVVQAFRRTGSSRPTGIVAQARGVSAAGVASPAVPEPAAAAATIPANNVAVTGAVTTAFKPKEPKEAIVTEGANRMRLPWKLLLAQSIFAGTCVSIGGMLFCSVGADAANLAAANPGLGRFLSGAIGWPVAIMLATFTGSSPFTANLLFVFQALFAGKGSAKQGAKVLGITWLGCFLGTLACAAICVAGAAPAVKGATAVALKKSLLPPMTVFFRSIFAGWLIALAVVIATASQDAVSKMTGIWVCVSTYAMCEFDHALSNMVLYNVAMLAGAKISLDTYLLGNLLPATLGNAVGAGMCVAGLMCAVHSGVLSADAGAAKGGAGAAGGGNAGAVERLSALGVGDKYPAAGAIGGASGAQGTWSVSALSAFGGLRLPSLRRKWNRKASKLWRQYGSGEQ